MQICVGRESALPTQPNAPALNPGLSGPGSNLFGPKNKQKNSLQSSPPSPFSSLARSSLLLSCLLLVPFCLLRLVGPVLSIAVDWQRLSVSVFPPALPGPPALPRYSSSPVSCAPCALLAPASSLLLLASRLGALCALDAACPAPPPRRNNHFAQKLPFLLRRVTMASAQCDRCFCTV